MTTINLAVTVELNDDLTADEISALTSDLIFAVSRGARNEVKDTVRLGHVGLTATVTAKAIEDEVPSAADAS